MTTVNQRKMNRPFECLDISRTTSLLARSAAISLAEPAWINYPIFWEDAGQ